MQNESTARPHVLRDYALLGDGRRGALVGPRGDISWLCVPRWDGPAVFSSLLGGPSDYSVTPSSRFVWGGYYEPNTLIWRSRWVVGSSVVECREALALPADRHRALLLRQIRAVRGAAELDVTVCPGRGDSAAPSSNWVRDERGRWLTEAGDVRLRWTGAAAARPGRVGDRSRLHLRVVVAEGQRRDLLLELSDRALSDLPAGPDQLWAETEEAWRRHTPDLSHTAAPRDAGHAFALLRGMTSDTGAMVAAATTSLPERADRGVDYDYRYAWIRDQCIAGQAVAAVGGQHLLGGLVDFVAERVRADGARLVPAYTVEGAPVPAPRELGLPGYPGAVPYLGNQVGRQFQLDIFGEVLLLMAAAGRHDQLNRAHREAVAVAVAAIAANYERRDAGIWELDERHWTHSLLSCVAGLRAVAACPATGADRACACALADVLLARAARGGLHRSGRWQRSPDLPDVDAALLLPMVRGAVAVDDPRYAATFVAVERELCDDFSVYRFRHDERPLEVAEGAFLLCGFTMAMAAAQLRHPVTAMRYFERNRAGCGPPGLFTEEFDVRQRQLRGNLPQAFVHAALLETAARLGTAREEKT